MRDLPFSLSLCTSHTADDRYAPLLALPTDPSSEKDKDGNVKEPTAEVVHARDLLPEAQQAAMVLEARADIIDAERGLREIDVLAKRGVAGAEGLEGASLCV